MISYETLTHEFFNIDKLPSVERELYRNIKKTFDKKPLWNEFKIFCMNKISDTFEPKLSRKEVVELPIYRICQDMWSRLGIEQGYVRQADYRDILATMIYRNFPSRYQFCKAVGIDEAFLSNVLNKKKNFSIETLENILDKIGYRLEIQKKAA